MPNNAQLDIAWVRDQFPGLKSDWVFFDNAGGSQILNQAVERIKQFLLEKTFRSAVATKFRRPPRQPSWKRARPVSFWSTPPVLKRSSSAIPPPC